MKRIHVDVRVEHDTPYDARHRMLNALEVMGFKGGWKGDVLETSAKESFSTNVNAIKRDAVKVQLDADWPRVEGLDIWTEDVVEVWGEFASAYDLAHR